YQIEAGLHQFSLNTIDCRHRAVRAGGNGVLHLHRLEDHQRHSLRHNIAHLHQNFQDHAGHRRAGGVVAVAGLRAGGFLVDVDGPGLAVEDEADGRALDEVRDDVDAAVDAKVDLLGIHVEHFE